MAFTARVEDSSSPYDTHKRVHLYHEETHVGTLLMPDAMADEFVDLIEHSTRREHSA